MPPLKNFRHELFCQEYFKDGNRIRAYQAAGYRAKTRKDGSFAADATICNLLKTPKVKARIAELHERTAHRLVASKERTLNELARIAFSDPRKLLGANGAIADPAQWDDDSAAAVAGLETYEEFEGRGKTRAHIGNTTKIKLWDKNAALTNLAKHFKLVNDDKGGLNVNVMGTVNFYLPENNRDVISNGHATEPELIGNGAGS